MARFFQSPTVLVFGVLSTVAMFAFVFVGPVANSATNPSSYPVTQQQSLMMGSKTAAPTSEDELQPEPFALIELFTSEGCSSCPSADKNLERITADAKSSGKNVYTLSYHVDYWNYIGWKDPYSTKQFSDRQRGYAKQFKSSRIYTPQMVVNGQVEFVGSKQKVSNQAVNLALQTKTNSAISIKAVVREGVVRAHWEARGSGNRDRVQVALVQNFGEQKVNRGENARRKLTHVNIVRQLETVAAGAGKGEVELDLPDGLAADKFHVVAFLQSPAAVIAADKSEIATNLATPTSDHRNGMTSVTALKPAMAQTQEAKRQLVSERQFIAMLSGDQSRFESGLEESRKNWDASYVPMLLEVARFTPRRERAKVMSLIESKTGQQFGNDFDKWLQWNWKQSFEPHPGYGNFKAALYRRIDPRFAEYFVDTANATIRLDEIRWGGVRRDGIPPLKDPKMLAARDASYLADSDVVFGIELNGDARAYPKRILAWHEMFKDTIGGESVCGVY